MGAGETGAAVRAHDQAVLLAERVLVEVSVLAAAGRHRHRLRHPAGLARTGSGRSRNSNGGFELRSPGEAEARRYFNLRDRFSSHCRSSTTASCTFGLSAASALFSRVGCTRFVRKTT